MYSCDPPSLPPPPPPPPPPCTVPGVFVCPNGQQLSRDWVCDGHMDCEGGEDEMNCGGTSPSYLVFISLLILCTCAVCSFPLCVVTVDTKIFFPFYKTERTVRFGKRTMNGLQMETCTYIVPVYLVETLTELHP